MSNNTKSLFWNEEIVKKLDESLKSFFNNWLDESFLSKYNETQIKLDEAVKNYKTNHSNFKYYSLCFLGLPLSFITIIPFYWAWKKFKKMKENKKMLEVFVNEAGKEKLKFHHQALLKFNEYEFKKIINDSINYKEMGPIHSKLIEELKDLSLMQLESNQRNNPYKTSWGVLDNKIIINKIEQIWRTTTKTYHGSVTVTENKETRTISATYTHPYEEIVYEETPYTFMESCSDLEFEFNKPLKGIFNRKENKKDKAELENQDFEKLADWNRSNEAQFRMIFTPLGQENYVNEINHIDDKKIPNQYRFNKTKSFFYNLKNSSSSEKFDAFLQENLNKFRNDFYITIDSLKNKLLPSIHQYIYEKFLSLIYLWMIPIFSSEDQSSIIKRTSNKFNESEDNYNDLISYFMFNNVLKHKTVVADTDTFHLINKYDAFDVNGIKINKELVEGLAFKKVEKTKYVYVSGHSVPVDYIDCIPVRGKSFVICSQIKSKDQYSYNKKYLDNKDEILSVIDEFKNRNIYIASRDNFIMAVSNNDFQENDINDFANLVKLINKK